MIPIGSPLKRAKLPSGLLELITAVLFYFYNIWVFYRLKYCFLLIICISEKF
jgi:hypothetical protein